MLAGLGNTILFGQSLPCSFLLSFHDRSLSNSFLPLHVVLVVFLVINHSCFHDAVCWSIMDKQVTGLGLLEGKVHFTHCPA